ncbi:hypothetical protein OROGR_030742 [Orobanche gracilis]
MVVTRSKSGTTKKADDAKIAVKQKVAERSIKKTTAERASKQTRKKERTNWAVMDSALCIFMEETFKKQHREKHPAIKITSEVIKAGEKEWISMTASDKALYITEAEKRFAKRAEVYKQNFIKKVTRAKSGTTKKVVTKNAVKQKVAERTSKQTRKRERTNWAVMDSALCIFMEETFKKQHREKHPAIKITSEVIKAGEKEWISMTASDKALYITEAEKRFAKRAEVYKQVPLN